MMGEEEVLDAIGAMHAFCVRPAANSAAQSSVGGQGTPCRITCLMDGSLLCR